MNSKETSTGTTGGASASELLDLADHIGFTSNLAKACQMAVAGIQCDHDRKALDCLLDTILDRLSVSLETLEAMVATSRGSVAA